MRDILIFIFVLYICMIMIRHQIKSKVTYKHFFLFFIVLSIVMVTYITNTIYAWLKFGLELDYWLVLTLFTVLVASIFSLIRILKS